MVATGWVVVQSTWLKRESVDGILKRAHFSGERERERSKKREEFKRMEHSRARRILRGWGEVCPGYLTSAF